MKKVTLSRCPSTDNGTFGKFKIDSGEVFDSLELPDRGNANGVSCIPAGVYVCKLINSPKHGECYQVTNVPHRDMIEIHSANFAGDKIKGKDSQLLGCIALGKGIGELKNSSGNMQPAILSSKQAIAEFESVMNKQDFELTIVDA